MVGPNVAITGWVFVGFGVTVLVGGGMGVSVAELARAQAMLTPINNIHPSINASRLDMTLLL
jgi:hypothetical protein